MSEFSFSSRKSGLSFVLGGMVGPLACLRVQESECSLEEGIRVVALAMEGAARVGVGYAFHPQKEALTSLCEDLIACSLLAGENLENVAGKMQFLFSCIPKSEIFSHTWFQEIRSAVNDAPENERVEQRDLPDSSLSIEPLYHQSRFLCETLICTPYSLFLEQQTTALALDSILSRHIKAAGKRLRVDQIETLEIELLSGVMDDSLKEHLAAQMVFYPDPIPALSDRSPKQNEEIEHLMNIIHIEESDWRQHWNMEYQALGRVYMTATPQERREWMARRSDQNWLHFWWMERSLKNRISIEEYSFLFPVSLRLHTSRGGCWKESIECLHIAD